MDLKKILSERLAILIDEKKDENYQNSIPIQAKAMEIPYPTFVKYIKGDAECPASNIVKIAKYYDVSTDYLLGNDIPSPNTADLQSIKKYTGLGAVAVKNLYRYAQSEYYCDQMIIRYINVLLGDVGINLFPIIDEYIQSVKHCAFLEKLYPDIDFSTKASPIYLCTGTKTPIKKQPVENEAEIKQEYFAENEGKQPFCLYTIQKLIVEFVERYGKVTADKFDIDKFVAEYKKIEESKTAKTDDIISAFESLKGTFDSIKKKIDLIKEEGAENG